MNDGVTRRKFLAAAGVAALTLRADAEPTPESGDLGAYGDYLAARGEAVDAPAAEAEPRAWVATEPNILGPFHRAGAPFRGKLTPPLAAGTPLVVAGRVWSLATRKPLPDAVLDLWQADHAGRYDNDDPRRPPAPGVFVNRARVVVDGEGRYEYETIHPGAYRVGPDQWRPPHVHHLVRAPGHKTLVTQLYFRNDPHQADDPFIRPALIIDLERLETDRGPYERGTFDIVLAPA